MKQAQFFRERISPWYDRRSDLQGSIRDAEERSVEPTSLLLDLDNAQTQLYSAVSDLATTCDGAAAQRRLRIADKFGDAAELSQKGLDDAAGQSFETAVKDSSSLVNVPAQRKCSCM
jgi:hypothetical protein